MLKNVSTEELEAELKKRKEAEQEMAIPKQLSSFDFSPLQKICQDYINAIAKEGYADEDYDHYIYETAIECIFGKDVWHWINSVKS